MKTLSILVFLLLTAISLNSQNVITVTKTTDPDPFLYFANPDDPAIVGTFQWAIRKANESGVPCVIVFAIPGSGQQVIYLNYDLPTIVNSNITIDATTQPDYIWGEPTILLDGNSNFLHGIRIEGVNQVTITGINFRNFKFSGINCYNSSSCTFSNNIINSIGGYNLKFTSAGIIFTSSMHNTVKGNIIGTDINYNSTLSILGYGIVVSSSGTIASEYNVIGGTSANEGNIIAYCGYGGINIYGSITNYNKISGNRIFNNPVAIIFYNGANNSIQPPIITSYSNETITGTSQPNDIIEIFGSIGNEKANEYLETAIADVNGNWTTTLHNSTWNYAIATATDVNNNTSAFSQSLIDANKSYWNPSECLPPTCGLISNGDFSSYVSVGWDYTILAGEICQWNDAWGSPEYNINKYHSASPSLSMIPDISGTYPNFTFGTDAIFTPVNVKKEKKYNFSFWFTTKFNVDKVTIAFTNTNYNPTSVSRAIPTLTKKDIVTYSNLNNYDQSSDTYTWEIKNFNNIVADADYNYLLIYPELTNTQSGERHAFFYVDDISLTAAPELSLTTSTATPTFCQSTTITATSGFANYQWSNSSVTTNSITVTPTTSTTYQVTATDMYGCVKYASKYIPITGNTYEAGPDQVFCNSTTTSIGSSTTIAGATYSWTSSPYDNTLVSTSKQPTVTPLVTTTYTVVVNVNGCTITDNLTIYIISAELGNNKYICVGDPVVLSTPSNPSGTTYLWNTGSTSNSITSYPTNTTTYYVTVTNNGCVKTDQITVNVITTFVASACSDINICLGSCANVFAVGGDSYYWSNNVETSSFIVCPTTTSPTTYYVTISNNYGCTKTDEVKVTAIPVPQPSFTFNKFDNCEDESSVDFTATWWSDAIGYTWNFGDGTIVDRVTSNTISHTYTNPGYYNVTLTAFYTYGCGRSVSNTIYIIPSTDGYNNACCFKQFTDYSYTDLNITYDEGGAAWYTTKYIKGTITIESGAYLYISNTSVFFGPQGKIIVKPGATLDILDNSTLTSINYSDCGSLMWQGIEVNNYGRITIKNSTISNAHNAVILGQTKLIPITNSFGYGFKFNGHEASSGGGIITATNASFENNGVDVLFWEHETVDKELPPPLPTVSEFKNCTFTCTAALLDPYYKTTNSINYSTAYMKLHNPFIAGANPTGRTVIGAYMYKVNDITFNSPSTTIDPTTFNNIEKGISSVNSQFTVNNCNFNNHNTGIFIKNDNNYSPLLGCEITNSYFESAKQYGIYIEKGLYDNLNNNHFNELTLGSQANNLYGIYLRNTSVFDIRDNYFYQNNVGLYCANSGSLGQSVIGRTTDGNIFTGCKYGITVSSSNSDLLIRCNKHIPYPYSQPFTANWNIVSSDFPDQGSYGDYGCEYPAGNQFQVLDRKYLQSSYPFTYISQFEPSYVVPTGNNTITIDDDGNTYTPACCATIPSKCYNCSLSDYKIALEDYNTEFENISNNIDNGQTAQLLTSIAANTSDGNLKNLLVNNSPLSDEVLVAFIDRIKKVAPGIFKEVMTPNLPVSEDVKPSLDVKLTSLPVGIAKQITEMQKNNPSYRTLTAVTRDINIYQLERKALLTNTIKNIVQSGNDSLAVQLLESENTNDANTLLAEYYISKSDFELAIDKLNTLPIVTAEEQAFNEINNLLISLYSDSLGIFSIDSAQEALVRTIAYSEGVYTAKSQAQAMLYVLYGEEFSEEADPSSYTIKSYTINKEFTQEQIDFIQIFNSGTQTVINCNNQSEKGSIVLYDALGRNVRTFELTEGINRFEIDNKTLPAGVYIGTFIVENVILDAKKFVINNK